MFRSNSSSDLRHLLNALRADLIMIVSAYCDESGTDENSPYTCVAGYVFEPDQCVRLETEWSAMLDLYGIKAFHMADCAHGAGEFKKLTKPDRVELATQCIGIIKRRARMGVVASMSQSDFKRFQSVNGIHDAYVLCLIWCMAGMAAWASRMTDGGRISYFFESGATLQKRANAAIEWSKKQPHADDSYYSHTFIGKRDAKAIQAADLLAWEWQSELKNFVGPPRRTRRRSLVNLLGAPHIYSHMSYDHMGALLSGLTDENTRKFYPIFPNERELMVVTRKPI